ncbi:uncharacterized protein LOC129921029 [Episyrphus balteatus]|uniref:uncharacterized protein LOC129921029 n=1 Tax=Episyrphus balteatus TaxID=286459 RepID=UPI002484F9CA|nr:uncharacterized protein LOC129921029 [Episyrphus balteatus]
MSPSMQSEIEKDFENFLNFCERKNLTRKDMQQVCEPLFSSWRWRFWKRVGIVLVALSTIWWLCINVEVLNWSLSAIGKLILIELLPYWNWKPLYSAKCLVDKNVPEKVESIAATLSLGKYETDKINCVLCEKLEFLPSLTNVTYSMIEQKYLEKGLPVIIQDSHPNKSLKNILSTILEDQGDFLTSRPCNIETNLLMKKFFTIETALDKIAESSASDEWFLQFRNCQFDAVKASRKFIRRPYYYPLHFEPFYSSWILMSNNYKGVEKELYLQGLIFIQQLSGEISITLIPKSPCEKLCMEIEFILVAGEGLVFSTDLWIFSYKTLGAMETVTNIMEIDWHY